VKFLLMVFSNPTSRALWEELSEDDHVAFGRRHLAFRQTLVDSGELVASAALADQAAGHRVRLSDGTPLVTDGPFAEVKEYLGGFYLVDCDSVDRAVELAAQLPDAEFNDVEVRPIMDTRFLEEW
jgi:hypothetical protein